MTNILVIQKHMINETQDFQWLSCKAGCYCHHLKSDKDGKRVKLELL